MNKDLLALLPELIVTDHDTCGEVLAKGECYDDAEDVDIRGPFAHVVSLVGTWEDDGDPPGGWKVWDAYPARKLRLQFDDVLSDSSHGDAPTEDHIRQIIAFANGLDGRTLIHCAAGVSRSTATALVLIATILGPGREEDAVAVLRHIKKMLRPHQGIVGMADTLLKREGALIAAHRAVWGTR